MKLVKKSKLTMWNGLVMKGDKIVAIDSNVVHLANTLEDQIQRKKYDLTHSNNKCCCCSNNDEPYTRVHEGNTYKVTAETPTLDEATMRSLAIMEDIDRKNGADKMNESLEKYKNLLDFVNSDKVIISKTGVHKLDTPTLGNILELTLDDVYEALAFINDGFTYDCEDEAKEN